MHVCDLLDDFSINSSLMLRTCFFLPFLYWSCVINSIIGLRITVSGSTNIFTACVVFWRDEKHKCHPTQRTFTKVMLLWCGTFQSLMLWFAKLEAIFINMLGGDSSVEESCTLFNTQKVICKSECWYINPKEDHNRVGVDEPTFHWVKLHRKPRLLELPWWSSGYDSVPPFQGA